MLSFLLVGVGGAFGAMARLGVAQLADRWWVYPFPIGTLIINASGSLLMGLLMGALARFAPPSSDELRLFLAVGVIGGFTTFSAFSLDTIVLMERGEWAAGTSYAMLSVVLSVGALYLGLLMMRGMP